MNKIIKKNILSAVILNFVLIAVYFLFFNIIVETNDELAFSAFLSGAYRTRSSHLVFSNIFYGGFLELLYRLELGVNWYSIFQILFNFGSFVIITFISLMKTEKYEKHLCRSIICFSVLLVLAYQHYYLMQWTKSAYLIVLAGVLLIIYTLHELKGNKFLILIGYLFVLVGSFIRFDATLVVFAFTFMKCVDDLLIVQKFEFNKKYFIRNGQYIVTFIILIVTIFGFEISDKLVYKYGVENDKWEYYNEYNVMRSELLDYGIPDYEEHAEEYLEIGLTETDVAMLKSWTFSDPEVFNVDTFEKIIALKEKRELSVEVVWNTIENVFEGAKTSIGLILIAIGFLYELRSKQKHKILVLMYVLMTFVLYGYLTYMDRVIFRTEYGIWLCLLGFLIYDFPEKEAETNLVPRLSAITYSAMVITILCISLNDYRLNYATYTRPLQTQYREIFDYTNSHKENLYMRDVGTLCDWHHGFSPWEALPYGYFSNIYLLGGWEIENPITDVKQTYGIENPWRECVDSEQICIIDNSGIELKLNYIRQRYCSTAEAVQVDEVAGFKIYKIVSGL